MNRYHLVRAQPAADSQTWTKLRISRAGFQEDIVLPHAGGIEFIFKSRRTSNATFIDTSVPTQEFSGGAAIYAGLKFLTARKDAVLRFNSFDVLADGAQDAQKAVVGAIRRLRKSGAPLDGAVFKKFPELLIGWKDNTRTHFGVNSIESPRICVVVHMYYNDVWDDLENMLKSTLRACRTIFTLAPGNETLVKRIKEALPHAEIFLSENTGKDVRPFLLLLEQGRFDEFDYVCKIHGKKSTNGGRSAILGDIWRNRMIFDLIAAPDAAGAIVSRFKHNSDVGLIGPTAYRYPSSLCNVERSWGGNKARVLELAGRLGVGKSDYELDFFCGTMFWVRPEALKPLRELRLSAWFAPENGEIDGELEHAVERLFTTSVKGAGYRVEGITGASLTFSDSPL